MRGVADDRRGWPVMALVQALAVRVEPGIGALCAGASGIAVVLVVRRMPHGSRPVEPDRVASLGSERVGSIEPVRVVAREPAGVAAPELTWVATVERDELDDFADRVAARAAAVP